MYPTEEEAKKRLHMIDIQIKAIERDMENVNQHLYRLTLEHDFLAVLLQEMAEKKQATGGSSGNGQ